MLNLTDSPMASWLLYQCSIILSNLLKVGYIDRLILRIFRKFWDVAWLRPNLQSSWRQIYSGPILYFYQLCRKKTTSMASNETVLVENARSRIYYFLWLYIASSTVLKQHFQLVQLHMKPSNFRPPSKFIAESSFRALYLARTEANLPWYSKPKLSL